MNMCDSYEYVWLIDHLNISLLDSYEYVWLIDHMNKHLFASGRAGLLITGALWHVRHDAITGTVLVW